MIALADRANPDLYTDDELMVRYSEIIEYVESFILDDDEPVYLLTYSPDPSMLPDTDFKYTHLFNVNLLADYLSCCNSGLFCVEATQRGNPHYHGWYKVNDEKELARIVIVKTLERYGNLKFSEVKYVDTLKINTYYQKGNVLYYYKKELFSSMLRVPHPVITKDTYVEVNWAQLAFFDKTKDKKFFRKISDVDDERKHVRQFYTDSTL